MSAQAQRLYNAADRQIAGLATRLSAAGAPALARPVHGREKLGDGTVAAVTAHTTENYHRMARFIAADAGASGPHGPAQHGTHRAPELDLDGLLARLDAAQLALAALADLSDEQLDSVPPAGTTRFADGQRTLADILTRMLKHQAHQLTAVESALAANRFT